ncbi:hypothetical protein Pla22_48070 [Rubripirellula amarantea]|uniref:UspA domain-containing protein n=1 Tax=Rubripirellula amarantea TaxID=2527999 RepID=A0A5C5WG38_9BACT|nr:universal stress protein [Rubripirellula amarantea]TWT49610.1 hypothetical protein Pla22_48070 [Rubripirellula amarantea]
MKKVLLATDGSEPALQAARFVARLPHDGQLELIVVTAVFVSGREKTLLDSDWIAACLAQERKQADQAYKSVVEMFEGANVSLRQVVREGLPAETIVQVANEVRPDLVVIGATGHSAIARVLLGSTSDYIATHAPCSTLVVRPNQASTQNHPLQVTIGYDETGPAQAALEEFAEFRWGSSTKVDVVTVATTPALQALAGGKSEDDQRLTQHAVDDAAQQIREVAPNAIGRIVNGDHVGEGLVKFVESNRADLLIVGETPRTRLNRMLMGSMTRFVLRHAPCSVWITRNRMIEGVKKRTSKSTVASQ